MDSPGCCAMYATRSWTIVVMKSIDKRELDCICLTTTHVLQDILAVLDNRECDGKSPNMEPEAFCRCLDVGPTIKEVVNDAHVQIPPILSESRKIIF